jgi:hypothetical protein
MNVLMDGMLALKILLWIELFFEQRYFCSEKHGRKRGRQNEKGKVI